MFTKSTLLGLKTFFQLQRLFSSGPYIWRSYDSTIAIHSSRLHWFAVYGTSTWFFIRTLYMLLFVIHAINVGMSGAKLTFSVPMCEWFMVLVVYQVNMFLQVNEIKGFANRMLHFNRKTIREF